MNRNRNTPLLPFPVISAAAKGDVEAVNKVLKHYAGYIAKLSMLQYSDENGSARMYVDEELRRRLETKLIAAILTFRTD